MHTVDARMKRDYFAMFSGCMLFLEAFICLLYKCKLMGSDICARIILFKISWCAARSLAEVLLDLISDTYV